MNTKAAGKAAIHCACAAGNVDVLKVIMEFAPNVESGGMCIILASAVYTTCVCVHSVYGVILCWSAFLNSVCFIT